jgi:hypothetical protein
MVKEFISGQMVEHMRAGTSKIKKKDTEFTPIQTAEATKVCGPMASSMAMEFVSIQTAEKLKEYGTKEKE